MSRIKLQLQNIKGVSCANIEIPIDNKIYALVGGNGSGKSTILQSIAQLIRPKSALYALRANDYDENSNVHLSYETYEDKWEIVDGKWQNSLRANRPNKSLQNSIEMYGLYEGSLFVGTRFDDSLKVDDLIDDEKLMVEDVIDANLDVINDLSFILHGNHSHYRTLKRLRNASLRKKYALKNSPHFIESRYGGLISQYRMSSGECLLISLLDFIHNVIIRNKTFPKNKPILMLLDEIELALHPKAVSRFLDILERITERYSNLTAILTTHAPEVIRRVLPENTIMLEKNHNSVVSYQTNVYPSYTIGEVYTYDIYDYLILCEDDLAKSFIDHIIDKNNWRIGRRIHVTPVGGWENVLKVQADLGTNFVVSKGTFILSALDGDVANKCAVNTDCSCSRRNSGGCANKGKYVSLVKTFLPIASVEKFLFDVMLNNTLPNLKKIVNDKYFQVKSIEDLNIEYRKGTEKESPKNYYSFLIKHLSSRNVKKEIFLEKFYADVFQNVNYSIFEAKLLELITK